MCGQPRGPLDIVITEPAVEQGSFLPDVQYDLITDYGAHLAVKASLPPRAGGRQDELGRLMLQCRKMCCAPPEKSHSLSASLRGDERLGHREPSSLRTIHLISFKGMSPWGSPTVQPVFSCAPPQRRAPAGTRTRGLSGPCRICCSWFCGPREQVRDSPVLGTPESFLCHLETLENSTYKVVEKKLGFQKKAECIINHTDADTAGCYQGRLYS
ncbi:Immunoglobulin alpha Fc receptor [Manis javanica]|nr:Immunoglobulin alpha Fc receptor [Manis javanica]